MTTFKNTVNAFGNSAGDSLTEHCTNWKGRGALPKGKLGKYPGAVGDISDGNRRLSKAKYGTGGGSSTAQRGTNAFTKGGKGK
jgi:hypothetical protein